MLPSSSKENSTFSSIHFRRGSTLPPIKVVTRRSAKTSSIQHALKFWFQDSLLSPKADPRSSPSPCIAVVQIRARFLEACSNSSSVKHKQFHFFTFSFANGKAVEARCKYDHRQALDACIYRKMSAIGSNMGSIIIRISHNNLIVILSSISNSGLHQRQWYNRAYFLIFITSGNLAFSVFKLFLAMAR